MPAAATNPNDAIRSQILRYFYDRNARATSQFGKAGSAIKISDVKRQLKALQGLTQQQVMSNLTYLIDRGWVNTVEQKKSVSTARGTTVPSVVTFYTISAEGIDKIEGSSEFQASERYPGININATGSTVITLGDGNVVNASFRQLFEDLSGLKEAITSNEELSDEAKLDAAVDIETLKDQLAKAKPDPDVVSKLWPRIEKAAGLAGLAGLALQLAPMVQQLIR
jgi:hypothetical protein